MKCSYLEIYNECINDLLGTGKSLDLQDVKGKGIQVQGLEEYLVISQREALELFNRGEENRKTGKTEVNDHSSRSHAIFRINLEIRTKGRVSDGTTATLNLIDLAGSEGINKTNATGARKK